METIKRYFYGRVVVYPIDSAMRGAINIWTSRYGYICFKFPRKDDRSWYFYISPNATPWAATFAIGTGIERRDKQAAPINRKIYGYTFRANHDDLAKIKDIIERAKNHYGNI